MRPGKTSSGLSTCLLLLLLAGCGTSAPVRYYGLVPVETQVLYPAPEEFAIAVGPVRIAEYLNRQQIVTRAGGVSVELGNYDRWTEPLAEACQRTLTDNLATLLGSDRVLEYPAHTAMDHGYVLPAQITRFDTDAAGLAVLEVQWTLRNIQENVIIPARRSRYTGPVSDPNDYESIVESLSELVGAFSRDVAAALAELP
ncbi:MAG: PqiC family protein [Gammaproteobacteria bacterium]|nr:PqiC family protein [Gammaproteobacteria bacterium]